MTRSKELNDSRTPSSNLENARTYLAELRENFIPQSYTRDHVAARRVTWRNRLKGIARPFWHSLKYVASPRLNRLKGIGPTIDDRSPRIIFRDAIAHWKNTRHARNFPYEPLERHSRYIYHPLQYQPEAAIDAMGIYFSNQIETARQIAMSLPDDYTLIVKDHPMMEGMRPGSYYEKLARSPNIRLVDYRHDGHALVQHADLVIAVGGTSLIEAAVYGVPVIQLGEFGFSRCLPNIHHLTDMQELAAVAKRLLKTHIVDDEYERRVENYFAAALDTGFTFDHSGVWEFEKKLDVRPFFDAVCLEVDHIRSHGSDSFEFLRSTGSADFDPEMQDLTSGQIGAE